MGVIIYYCTAALVCLNLGSSLGSSLGSTKDQLSNEERFGFFDAELFQVLNEKQSGNLLLSPIGVKLLLGMLMEGAEGGSGEEIRAALRLPHDAQARRKEFNSWLSKLQVNDTWNILKMANRVFMSDHCTPTPHFRNALEKHYSAGITRVSFQDSREATKAVNDWVANQTSQLIPAMVEEGQIRPEHQVLVTSAVYFKGHWSRPFASDRTTVRCFYSGDNICRDATMMTETGNFDYGYIARLKAKAVVLPYKGGKFSMLLLLPSKGESAESLARDLLHVSLNSILSETSEQEVLVQIPHFEIAYNEDLAESLKKLGIFQVFDHRANLSKMFDDHSETTSVSKIYHSAKITVNEEGSEAAAATGAFFVPLMGSTTTSFVANRPFLFFVFDSVNNSILFAGKVASPLTSHSPKKGTFPSRPDKVTMSQNPPQEISAIPLLLPKRDYSRNASEESTRTVGPPEKLLEEVKRGQRGQSGGPRFRSIKPLFSIPRGPSPSARERGFSADSPNKSLKHSRPHGDTPKEVRDSKEGKSALEKLKTPKRVRPSSDDWRRHVLFFS